MALLDQISRFGVHFSVPTGVPDFASRYRQGSVVVGNGIFAVFLGVLQFPLFHPTKILHCSLHQFHLVYHFHFQYSVIINDLSDYKLE